MIAMTCASCALEPRHGYVGYANDSFSYTGGTPSAGSDILIECKENGTSVFKLIKTVKAESTLRPELTPYYGDFYLAQDAFVVPNNCWSGGKQAEIRIRNKVGSQIYNGLTYDQNGASCLDSKPNPWTSAHYSDCAMNTNGVMTLCRYGTTWNGTSCN